MRTKLPLEERMRNCLIMILGCQVNQWVEVSSDDSIANILKSNQLSHNYQPIIVDALTNEGCMVSQGRIRTFEFKIIKVCMGSISTMSKAIISQLNANMQEKKKAPKKPKLPKLEEFVEPNGKPEVKYRKNPNIDDYLFALDNNKIVEYRVRGIFRDDAGLVKLNLRRETLSPDGDILETNFNGIRVTETFSTPEALVANLLKNISKMTK